MFFAICGQFSASGWVFSETDVWIHNQQTDLETVNDTHTLTHTHGQVMFLLALWRLVVLIQTNKMLGVVFMFLRISLCPIYRRRLLDTHT